MGAKLIALDKEPQKETVYIFNHFCKQQLPNSDRLLVYDIVNALQKTAANRISELFKI